MTAVYPKIAWKDMSRRISYGSELKLLELKARVNDLTSIRERLTDLKAYYLGTLHQTDTYYEVPKGRLKMREVSGKRAAELIYYERKDIAEPKKSDVFILRLEKPQTFKRMFERILKERAVVEKRREIYRYKGTRIHLDTVEELGTFIEFERETSMKPKSLKRNREILMELMEKLGIGEAQLESLSYVDLLQSKGKNSIS